MVRIIIAQRLIFALTFPVLHPPFCLPNAYLPPSHPFFDSNTCVIGPHISLSIIMSKAVHSHNHHHENSDFPFRVFHSRFPERYVPSGQHLLLPNYDLYHLDVSTCHSSVGFPLGVSSRTLYTLPHRTDTRTSHVTTSLQEGHCTQIRGHLIFYQ